MNFNDIFKNFDLNFDFINFNVLVCGMNYLLIFLLLLIVLSSILIYAIILIENKLKQIKNKKGDKK